MTNRELILEISKLTMQIEFAEQFIEHQKMQLEKLIEQWQQTV